MHEDMVGIFDQTLIELTLNYKLYNFVLDILLQSKYNVTSLVFRQPSLNSH